MKRTRRDQVENVTFTQPYVLLVEGGDDEELACVQVGLRADRHDWQVHNMLGVNAPWGAALEVILDDATFSQVGRAIGLVIDADTNFEAALQKCHDLLARIRFDGFEVNGTVVSREGLRAGAFIMPGGTREGALEHLLEEAAGEARLSSARSYLSALEADGLGPFVNRQKSLIQAYLAAQRRITKTIPVGLRDDEVFDRNSPAFAELRLFLERLATP